MIRSYTHRADTSAFPKSFGVLQDIPGLSSLGYGYNVYSGKYASPDSQTLPLFDLGEKVEIQTDEQHTYQIPKSVTWTSLREGLFLLQSGTTISDYQTSLNSVTNLDGSYSYFSGSLEVDFGTTSAVNSAMEYSKATNVAKIWILGLPDPSTLQSYLLDSVKNDLATMDPPDIFDKYGTHYLWNLVVGARAEYSSHTNKLKYDSTFDLSIVAEMSFKAMVGSLSASEKLEYGESINAFNSASTTTVQTVGGRPEYAQNIAQGDYTKWIESVDERPVFVDFTDRSLRPIWELVSDTTRRTELEEAFDYYASGSSVKYMPFVDPIYQHRADNPLRYAYSSNVTFGDGWVNEGVSFYAYNAEVFDAIPFYQYHFQNVPGGPAEYLYLPLITNDKGFVNDGVGFYASMNPGSGTIPIYQFSTSAAPISFALCKLKDFNPGWRNDGIRLYAFED